MFHVRHTGLRQEDGAIAVIVALLMTMLLGMGALAIDVASFRLAQRQLQSATDAAALAGTYALTTATGHTNPQVWVDKYLAGTILVNNKPTRNYQGPGTPTAPGAQTGTYCPESGVSPGNRFTVGATDCPGFPSLGTGPNAVKVVSHTQLPLYLGRIFLPGTDGVGVTATATAAQISQAGFYAGSGLVSVSDGLINAVLGGLLGSNASLNVASYDGMLRANVEALSFFKALATNIGVTAGTYDSLLQSNVTVQQVLQAAIGALNAPGSEATVELQSLIGQISGSPNLQLSDLFDLGVWRSQGLDSGNSTTALQTALNVYQLATLAAQVANGSHAVTIPPSSLGIPGLFTVDVASTVIEPPVSPPFVFGPVGMTVHTAQVRLQLQITLLHALSLGGALGTAPVSLPIYVEVAPGEATLSGISCGSDPKTDALVTIQPNPAVARVDVGTVTPGAMSNFSARPAVTRATLVNVAGLVRITGGAEVALDSNTPPPLTFNADDIAAQTPKTVSSTGMVNKLVASLLPELTSSSNPDKLTATVLGADPLGLLSGILRPVTGTLANLLTPVFAELDAVVDGTLAALGIRIGYLDVAATGVRCNAPVLVN